MNPQDHDKIWKWVESRKRKRSKVIRHSLRKGSHKGIGCSFVKGIEDDNGLGIITVSFPDSTSRNINTIPSYSLS